MGSSAYSAIAGVYDLLNEEIDYSAWADFIEECFGRFCRQKPELVLDLACGTGRMTTELAKRGYDMTGVDASEDMLAVAYEKSVGKGILYLHQDMRSFELYGTVDAAVCCLDSLNYLMTDDELLQCFRLVHNYLNPDGLFIFDLNSKYKFEKVYADNSYILEDKLKNDGKHAHVIYCGWQNAYDRTTGICDFDLSLFEELPDGRYQRTDEHQTEKYHRLSTVRRLLAKAGMEWIGCWSGFGFEPVQNHSERWFVCARCKKD